MPLMIRRMLAAAIARHAIIFHPFASSSIRHYTDCHIYDRRLIFSPFSPFRAFRLLSPLPADMPLCHYASAPLLIVADAA